MMEISNLTQLKQQIENHVEEFVESLHQVNPEQVGLDYRCGLLFVGEDTVATKTRQRLDYYGGFEYIDKDNVTVFGEWTFYSVGCDNDVERVKEVIDKWNEANKVYDDNE